MFDYLEKIDQQLLLLGNSFHTAFLDKIVPYLTLPWVWMPLFAWWIFEIYKIYKLKIALVLVFVVVLLFAADSSSVFIKDSVKRYRPTHNTELMDKIHVVDEYRGGQYGYVSSHAANSFAVAFFLFLLLEASSTKWLKLSFFLWALIMCYTRIYLGVHYPFDLFSGALLGTILAFVLHKVFKRVHQPNKSV